MNAIDMSTWRPFRIGELFEIKKGKRLTKKDMIDGDIRYIGASALNNGVTAHISNDNHLHPAGVLTVNYNGSVGKAFYQDERFWASDDVNVLYPRYKISKYAALFVATIIEKKGAEYAFLDKWKLNTMKQDEILLPCGSDLSPDWDYMDEYMRKTEERVKNRVTLISGII